MKDNDDFEFELDNEDVCGVNKGLRPMWVEVTYTVFVLAVVALGLYALWCWVA